MRLAFDAKRAFHNRTGLGNYSRTLLNSLAHYFPENEYYLCNPRQSSLYEPPSDLQEINPHRKIDKLFPSIWRSKTVVRDLRQLQIQLYHGLSHEIPTGLRGQGIKSLVTIHDLIHERYPEQYRTVDVKIYSKKFRHACKNADLIIATSLQTRDDIVEFYSVRPEKIAVCYQSCDPIFEKQMSTPELAAIREKYQLPQEFLLYVGSVNERKNLLGICKALFLLRNDLRLPLLVIGDGKQYKEIVKAYLAQNGMLDQVIFLNEGAAGRMGKFSAAADLPGIYQLANALIYPSLFEGFGIPLLEAMWSATPVITSNLSSLPEVTGEAALFVDPRRAEDLAEAILTLCTDGEKKQELIRLGRERAQLFTTEKTAAAVMAQYRNVYGF